MLSKKDSDTIEAVLNVIQKVLFSVLSEFIPALFLPCISSHTPLYSSKHPGKILNNNSQQKLE